MTMKKIRILSTNTVMGIILFTYILALIPSRVLPQTIDFISAQSKLLENNPTIKAMQLRVEQYKKKITVTSSLPDPTIKLGLVNIPVTKLSLNQSDMTGKEIGFYQMFPSFGTLSTKERIALLEYKKAIENERFYTAYYLHTLRTYFFEIAYLHEYLKIIEETKQYLTVLLDVQKAKSSTGAGSLSDILKISVEMAKLDEEIITIKTTIDELKNNISYILGDSHNETKLMVQDVNLSLVKIEEFNPAFSEKVVAGNPELQLLSIQVLIDEEAANLKENELYPDVEVGVSYMQRDKTPQGVNRDDMFSVMATFNIPVWFMSKNIPAIQEMKIKKGESEALLKDKQNEITFALATLRQNIEKWKQLDELYSQGVIPQLHSMLQADIANYRTGAAEFMKLIDSIRMMLHYKQQQLNTIKEYCKAVSFLHFLQGDTSILNWSGVQ